MSPGLWAGCAFACQTEHVSVISDQQTMVCLLQDFMEVLGPLAALTHPPLSPSSPEEAQQPPAAAPSFGPLNAAAALLASDNPTYLGPLLLFAYGRQQEVGSGDSVRGAGWAMADVVSWVAHAMYGPEEEGQVVVRCGDQEPQGPR